MNRLAGIHRSFTSPGIAVACWLCALLALPVVAAAVVHLDGPHDLDRDGQGEFLIVLNRPGGPAIEYRELQEDGQLPVLWSFTPPPLYTGRITDVELTDLDGDGVVELLASYLVLGGTGEAVPWLYLFRWKDGSFQSEPFVLTDQETDLGRIRPSNLATFRHNEIPWLAVALGAPARRVLLLRLHLDDQGVTIADRQVADSKLVRSGYGRVYTGVITTDGTQRLLAFSSEGDRLKAAVFDLADTLAGSVYARELAAQVFSLGGARNLYGPGITAADPEGNGREVLLLPFRSGALLALGYTTAGLTLQPSTYEKPFLFPRTEETFADAIRRVLATRAAEAPEPAPPVTEIPAIVDTVSLGDTLTITTVPDTGGEFYSFRWLQPPPAGARFDPLTGTITWIPRREQLGPQPFVYEVELRVGERVVRTEDEMGERHQIVPVLEKQTPAFAILVQDTVTIDTIGLAADTTALPLELFSVIVTAPHDSGDNRFTFDGVPPFGLMVNELAAPPGQTGKLLGHHIHANLATVDRDKQVTFRYAATVPPETERTVYTLIHDLENHVLYVAISPPLDTLPQSFHPEAWDPELYRYPEYFFEGFPTSMVMDSVARALRFSFGPERPRPAATSISLVTPSKPSHYLTLNLDGGELLEVRGEVRVKENGTKKIIAEVDLAGRVRPTLILTRLRDEEEPADKRLLPAVKLTETEATPAEPEPAPEVAPDTTTAVTTTVGPDTVSVTEEADETEAPGPDTPATPDTTASRPEPVVTPAAADTAVTEGAPLPD
jgi:hypothetical protein